MRAPESNSLSQVAAGVSAAFPLEGGQYLASVVATGISGSNTVELQRLGPDGSTWLSLSASFNNAGTEADLVIGKFSANGAKLLPLAPGNYRWNVTTATNTFAEVQRVPGE